MYRWQTLTLARAERLLRTGDYSPADREKILADMAEILYRFRQRHFLVPLVVSTPPSLLRTPASRVIGLRWWIGCRCLDIEFAAGTIGYRTDEPEASGIQEGGGIDLRDCSDLVHELTGWLLNGERSPR